MFGAELSYMIKQDEEYFAEEKHLLEKLNISTCQKKWREATENLVKKEDHRKCLSRDCDTKISS